MNKLIINKWLSLSILCLFILTLTFSLSSCGGGNGSNTEPVLINSKTEVSAVITPSGGTIEVTNSESDLFQAKLVIPPDALNKNTVISLKKVDSAIALPEETTNGGVVIELGPDGTVFNSNILVTIPYDDADNDGIVDYTDISEDDLSVICWDSSTKTWVSVGSIINRDKENNTITFETNHFSKYSTSCPCTYGNLLIFTIDGLDFNRTYLGLFETTDYGARTAYLQRGLLESDLGKKGIIKKCDVYSYGGTSPDQAWEGDATETPDWIPGLVDILIAKAKKASDEGKKFIVVTHSWGTQLGTIALSLSGVEPDLFITLSDPAGSNSVDDNSYSNYWFKVLPPVLVKDAQKLVDRFVYYYGVYAYNPIQVKTNRWINYWDVGDLISGPLSSNNSAYSIENETVIDSSKRDSDTTQKVHAITSLSENFWKEYGVSEDGKAFRNKVIASIIEQCNIRQPWIVSSTPPNGATNVSPSSRSISWTFNEPMGIGHSVYWEGLGTRDQAGTFTSQWSADQKTCTLTYSKDWLPNSTISWTLNKTYQDFKNLSGIPLPTITGSFKMKPTAPVIAQEPMSAPTGTWFAKWGTGFTPFGTATLHFRKPDGTEYLSVLQPIDPNGAFSISGNIDNAPGTYTWWAVDGSSGMISNTVSYTITGIAQSPRSGPPGTTFVEWGTGFTPFGTATLHFRKPDGTEYPTLSQPLDSIGHFEITYTAPLDKPLGIYTWWAIDDTTSFISNTVCYEITPY